MSKIKEYGQYDVISRGKYPITADAKIWRSWEIRKYPRKFQLMLVTPRLDNETQYVSVGLTWSMMRSFLLEMEKYYGKEEMANELGVEFVIKDPIKWSSKLTSGTGCGNIMDAWN